MAKRTARSAGSGGRVARKGLLRPQAIFLVGFMGAGKSSVGRCLAEQLGWVFEDLDGRIERREHRRIQEIFRESGEAEFRRAERGALEETLNELRAGERRVVALGGGAFVQRGNAKLIEEAELMSVFLDAEVDELWRRCREQANQDGVERPLLKSLQKFRNLYESRRRHYARALFRQATDGKTVNEIAAELAKTLRSFTAKPSSGRALSERSSSGTSSSETSSSRRSDGVGAERKTVKQRERGGKN